MSRGSVTFSFRPSLSADAQQHALDEIRRWDGVVSAALLKPGSKNPTIARMGYVVLSNESDPEHIARLLGELTSVETAGVPAARYLIK